MVALGFFEEKFTWEKSIGKHNWVQERLDRALATQRWRELFSLTEIKVLEVGTSIHLPLYLQLNRQIYVRKEKRLWFENISLREKDCKMVVQNGWVNAATMDIMEKIKFCGFKL